MMKAQGEADRLRPGGHPSTPVHPEEDAVEVRQRGLELAKAAQRAVSSGKLPELTRQ